jgi:hypothetical protein
VDAWPARPAGEASCAAAYICPLKNFCRILRGRGAGRASQSVRQASSSVAKAIYQLVEQLAGSKRKPVIRRKMYR